MNHRCVFAGAALGLVRVIASLLNEPRPDGDAQRPLEHDGAAEPLALPAPGDDTPSGTIAAAGMGDAQPAGAEPAPVGHVTADHPPATAAAAQLGEQQAGAATNGPRATAPISQPDAAPGQALRPADALVPIVGTERGVPSAAGLPDVPAADVAAFDGRHPDYAAGPAASVAPLLQAPLAASASDLDAQQGGREQAPGGALAAQQLVDSQLPSGPVTGAAAAADASKAAPLSGASAQPHQLASAATWGEQPRQQVTVVSASPPEQPPRPQPPPPPQLLLLPDDASAEDVQEEVLTNFRELYPTFEPFQARGIELP